MLSAARKLSLGRLATIVTFVAVFAMAMRAPLDTDTLWHLRAGEWQFAHRSLLRVDLFSHTRSGSEWVNHSWLSQLVLYGMFSALGDLGLELYTALLATAGMMFAYLQMKGDPILKGFVIVLASAAAAVFWSARPQMLSFFLSSIVLYLLWLYQKRGVDRLWVLPLVFVLWANLHGGFAIGFILIVLAVLGEGIHWLVDGVLRSEISEEAEVHITQGPVIRLAAIGLISAAAISLNPYGPQMLLYPFRTVGIGVLRDFIQEWASPNFHMAHTWPFIWLLLGAFVMIGLSNRRLDWRDAILVSGTAYSALLAGRNIATFALVAAPVLSEHAEAWLAEVGYRLNWNRVPRGVAMIVANWLLLTLVIIGAGVKVYVAADPKAIAEARRELLPIDAVAHLEQNQPPGPLFNSYNWGGYLIWAARDFPVFVDGRTDLYNDDLLQIYVSTYFAQPGWDTNLNDAKINTVLVESSSPLVQVLELTGQWDRKYADGIATVYVRHDPIR